MTDHDTSTTTSTYAYLCIGCPLGCRLEVDEDIHGDIIEIRGSSCRKGDRYAQQEHTDPRRTVTTTVAISGAIWPRLPVKTNGEIPKDQVLAACEELRRVRVQAPVKMGDVVLDDLLGTGCAVTATRDMPAAGNRTAQASAMEFGDRSVTTGPAR
jgi:CxxC motif-containing protein